MDFMVMKVVWFIKWTRYHDLWNSAESNPRLKSNNGLLYPINKDPRNVIDDVGCLDIFARTKVFPFLSLLAWRLSQEYY